MTIKKVIFRMILMLFSYFILFSILVSVFGPDGYLRVRSLEKQYAALEKEKELYKVRIASLEERWNSSSNQSAMDDIALSLGYNREGEKVFYFDEPDEVELSDDIAVSEEYIELYEAPDTYILALYALCSPLLVLIVFAVSAIRKKRRGESYTDRSVERGEGSYDDYSF